ncbi:HCLS1-binding protein 3-like [Saccostrea echinata]|uniref:HCLS1-binding protein 3-like n=1 Tax=Saccostrea echinata TaxID=191078 RepID=UPI002A813A58|nr:HCLS1-binding protein 3-like [Saccostrea echinata]
MPSATVTIRELKNRETGIDITIPRITQEKGLLQSTYEYQVVVVSNLPFFKSPKHKESDVVQFMVKKKFAEFEDLWSKIYEKYPATVLPTLPKKALLVNDKVATDRRAGLERFLNFLAVTPKVCTSSLLLEFLGVNAIKAGKYTREGLKNEGETEDNDEQSEDKKEITSESSTSGLFEEDEEEEEEDLFNDEEDTDIIPEITTKGGQDSDSKLFDYPVLGGNLGADDKMFLLSDNKEPTEPISSALHQEEDDLDLLTVEDDLDELFISQPKPKIKSDDTAKINQTKPKPLLRPKPETTNTLPESQKPTLRPKPKVGSKPELKPKPVPKQPPVIPSHSEATSGISDLNTDDIMKYIQSAGETQEDVDLFS